MSDCCESKCQDLAALRQRQGNVLKMVFLINAVMFGLEAWFGWWAQSTALLADSLDMFGDATVYALTLWALHRSDAWRAGAALLKGGLMGLFGLTVLGQMIYRWYTGGLPVATTMGIMGGAALLANLTCLFLLTRHRSDDLNMESTWLCSRNDIMANLGVLAAAWLVTITHSFWPDVVVGLGIVMLSLTSATSVLKRAWTELKTVKQSPAPIQQGTLPI